MSYLLIGEGGDAEDVDGSYDAYLRLHGAEAVIVRPDFYVFGVAARLADLPGLVDDLLGQLALSDAASLRHGREPARSVA